MKLMATVGGGGGVCVRAYINRLPRPLAEVEYKPPTTRLSVDTYFALVVIVGSQYIRTR
jgi:hypothetical protein